MTNPSLRLMDTPNRRRAAAVRARYEQRVEAIRASRDITADGKRRQLAKAYLEAKNAIGPLQQLDEKELTDRRSALERQLYRFPNAADPMAAISMRDALDRAARVTSREELRNLLHRAEQSGDAILESALAQQAAERGYLDLLGAYAGKDTTRQEALSQLAELDGAVAGEHRLGRLAYLLSRPEELGNLNENAIAREADLPDLAGSIEEDVNA